MVEATIDNVDRTGMLRKPLWSFIRLLLGLILSLHALTGSADTLKVLTTFDSPDSDLDWRVVNDNVMGGRSVGGFEIAGGVLVFSGATNIDGGGFSSVRTGPQDFKLGAFQGLRLRVRGDGRTYTFRLSTDKTGVSYWARFPTQGDAWQDVELPFSSFWPNWRGRKLDEAPVVPADIRELGIMINDKNDGPFKLEVGSIQAF